MTNTRLTDPEILESRYPVRLLQFGLRSGSGGAGCWRGGDGIVREFEFLEAVELSLLTSRRGELHPTECLADRRARWVHDICLQRADNAWRRRVVIFGSTRAISLRFRHPVAVGLESVPQRCASDELTKHRY